MILTNLHEHAMWMKDILNQRERENFSPLAAFSENTLRRKNDPIAENGYRQNFAVDSDRILHSLAYTRYIDKTQVFSLIKNDHLTHRVLHVQLVSRIARTIGRYLGLNEDLIEAASMGHDLGHPPFGHDGEKILSNLTYQNGAGCFHHNVQSIQILEKLEQKGRGLNLTLQTLDAVLCHNGELPAQTIKPVINKREFKELDNIIFQMKQIKKLNPNALSIKTPDLSIDSSNELSLQDIIPITMEGCVVRVSDTIAYIGRDIEDSIRLNIIKREDIPKECSSILGTTNGTIVYNLVTDIINTSFRKPYIAFSQEITDALNMLKSFNYERIYLNPIIKEHLKSVKNIYIYLFETFLNALETKKQDSIIYKNFLKGLSEDYKNNHSNSEIVRDFIAGMTDSFFISSAPKALHPKTIKIKTNV